MTNQEALDKALRIFDGSQSELAEKLGEVTGKTLTQSQVANWVMRGQVSKDFATSLSKVVGGKVTREELRSDINWSLF